MNQVAIRIVNTGIPPTRADIAELLASIARPGEQLAEKESAVKQLFSESGHRAHNPQGHTVWSDLSGYEEF